MTVSKFKTSNKVLSVLLCLALLLSYLPLSSLTAFAADLQTNADGTYLLYTSDDLKAFADNVNGGNYDADAVLMDSITYEGTVSIGTADIALRDWDDGYTVSNIKGYRGVFDGNGHTVTMPVDMYLFGAIDGATVKNLTVSGGNKAIVAYMASGSVLSCNNTSTISGWVYCGGIVDIVGAASSTSTSDAVCIIRGCANYGNLNVAWNVGGVVGAARGKNVSIDNCANYGNFDLRTGRFVGGIVGKLTDGATVSYCFDSSTRSNVLDGNCAIAYPSNSTISNSFYVNGGAQTGATKVSGLTDDVLAALNQNPSGIKWSADGTLSDRWNVTFDANDGTGSMSPVSVEGEYTLPANGFTAPSGYRFKAWSVGDKEYAVGDKITVLADTTITAVWEMIPAEAPDTPKSTSGPDLVYGNYNDVQIGVTVNEKDGYTYSYQWYYHSQKQDPIVGETSNTYTLPNDLARGKHSFFCVVTGTRNDNGLSAETEVNVGIYVSRADSSIANAPEAKTDLQFNGQWQELVTPGTANGGSVWYLVTTQEIVQSDINNYIFSSAIPKAANVGTYYVWYKVAGDSNHKDTAAEDYVTVNIGKAQIEKPAENNTEFIYNGQEQSYFQTDTTGDSDTDSETPNDSLNPTEPTESVTPPSPIPTIILHPKIMTTKKTEKIMKTKKPKMSRTASSATAPTHRQSNFLHPALLPLRPLPSTLTPTISSAIHRRMPELIPLR